MTMRRMGRLLPGRKQPSGPPLPGGLKPALLNDYIQALFEQGWGPLTIRPSTTEGGTVGYTVDGTLHSAPGETMNSHIFGRTPAEAFYALGRRIGRHFSPNPLGDARRQAENLQTTLKSLERQIGTEKAVVGLYERLVAEIGERGNPEIMAITSEFNALIDEFRLTRGVEVSPGVTLTRPVTANTKTRGRSIPAIEIDGMTNTVRVPNVESARVLRDVEGIDVVVHPSLPAKGETVDS
jgi:hypothetical protein